HVDIEGLRALLDFFPLVVTRDLFRDNGDRTRRADELAKLTGNAAFAALLVGHESRGAAIMLGKAGVPFFLGVLHRHMGFAEQHPAEMVDGNEQPPEDAWK